MKVKKISALLVLMIVSVLVLSTLAYAAWFAYEVITVSTVAIGLTSATYSRATSAFITVEGNFIRFTLDGVTAPTVAGVGHRLEIGQSLTLGPPWGTVDDMRNFKAIRGSGAGDATIRVSYKAQ